MDFFRYVLLILEDEDKKSELINRLSDWKYSDALDPVVRSAGFSFTLINENENKKVFFKKLKDCVYTSINVLPNNIDNLNEICEPQEEDIHNDILFKLCMDIKKEFVNLEVRCGIIPCTSD